MRPATLGVIGIGAIGGAVARSAKRHGVPLVLGWPPDPAERVAAVREGVLDDAPTHAAELAGRCELLVLAAGPEANLGWLEKLAARLASGALITDTGVAKRPIVRRAAALGLRSRFAGSRPVAESPVAGLAGARADLVDGAAVYVTPVPGGDAAACEIADFWASSCGAHPRSGVAAVPARLRGRLGRRIDRRLVQGEESQRQVELRLRRELLRVR